MNINLIISYLLYCFSASLYVSNGEDCTEKINLICERSTRIMHWVDVMKLVPLGMSAISAAGYGYNKLTEKGVIGSEKAAREDFEAAREYKSFFQKASLETKIPMEIIAGIASRESRVGNDPNYKKNKGFGFDGQGYGLMQVDSVVHSAMIDMSKGPNSYENVIHGAKILDYFHGWMIENRADWSSEQQLQGAVAAYNCGQDPVPKDFSPIGVDAGTYNQDYSNDVLARAKYFRMNNL